jgi:ribonuclease E
MAEPGAQQPDLPPVYVGPTPADPFGSQAFDKFDALEQAEQRAQSAHPAAVTALPIVAGPPPAIEPTDDISPAPEAPPESVPVAEPTVEATQVSEPPPTPEPSPPEPANDREAEPKIRPIVIGADDTSPAEKKRGWWRR